MPRCTRSIILVLIGTGLTLPACDDRQRRDAPTPPPEPPDGAFGDGPTTNPSVIIPAANGLEDTGGTPYRYGPIYTHGYHSGIGWVGGSMFSGRTGSCWTPAYAGGSRSSFASSSSGGSHDSVSSRTSIGSEGSSESGGHTSFGGFGSHASSSHVSS